MIQYWLVRTSLYLAAFAAAGISLCVSLYFWYTSQSGDWVAQYLWCSLCVLSAFFKVSSPIVAALRRVNVFRCGALSALFVVALAFDVASSLGFARLTKGEVSRKAQNINISLENLERDLLKLDTDAAAREQEIKGRLQPLAAVRVTTRIETEKAAAQKLAGPCTSVKAAASEMCRKITKLETELQDARARDAFEAGLEKVRSDTRAARDALKAKIETAGAPASTEDAQAAAISELLDNPIFKVPAAAVSSGLGVLMFLLIELGATAPAAYAAALPRPPRAPEVPRHVPRIQVADAPGAPPAPRQKAVRAPPGGRDLADTLARFISGSLDIPGAALAADGWVYVSQTSMGELFGVSKAAMNRQIKAHVAAGKLQAKTGPGGTALKLPDTGHKNVFPKLVTLS